MQRKKFTPTKEFTSMQNTAVDDKYKSPDPLLVRV